MNILMPVETINREIDFKIVLAGILAGQGHKIYIGQHDYLLSLLPDLNGGIYIGKNIFSRRADIEKGGKYYLLKNNNFDIIYIHEEGAVFAGREEDWLKVLARQYNIDFFDEKDIVCLWGDFQKRFDESRNSKVKKITTGHPRFDLCKPEWRSLYQSDIDKIQAKYNNFILINGNYSFANHGMGLGHVFSDKGNYEVANVAKRMHKIRAYAYSAKQFISVVALTHELAVKYTDINFVYRPHPSENHDYYKTMFHGINNIYVIHEGPVLPWIFASMAIIHDGCTTALEAALAEKPVINYKPLLEEEEFDIWLPNQMGVRAKSVQEVYDHIDNLSTNNCSLNDNIGTERIKELMYNFKGNSFKALENVIQDKIKSMNLKTIKYPSGFKTWGAYWKNILKRNISIFLNPSKISQVKYQKVKFYGFDETYVNDKIASLEKVLDKKIKIKFHNKCLLEVV